MRVRVIPFEACKHMHASMRQTNAVRAHHHAVASATLRALSASSSQRGLTWCCLCSRAGRPGFAPSRPITDAAATCNVLRCACSRSMLFTTIRSVCGTAVVAQARRSRAIESSIDHVDERQRAIFSRVVHAPGWSCARRSCTAGCAVCGGSVEDCWFGVVESNAGRSQRLLFELSCARADAAVAAACAVFEGGGCVLVQRVVHVT